jgi:hypothetical protein
LAAVSVPPVVVSKAAFEYFVNFHLFLHIIVVLLLTLNVAEFFNFVHDDVDLLRSKIVAQVRLTPTMGARDHFLTEDDFMARIAP